MAGKAPTPFHVRSPQDLVDKVVELRGDAPPEAGLEPGAEAMRRLMMISAYLDAVTMVTGHESDMMRDVMSMAMKGKWAAPERSRDEV